MEKSTYLDCLEHDYQRLREVGPGGWSSPVPSCPGWTMADLVRHVAEVYLHKTEIMRTGANPEPWPPDLSGEDPVAALDRAYAGLVAELTARKPDEPALTWYGPDQTVGFWVRRMAHETVIHRIDAELAAGADLAPIPEALALDGIDEVLVCFLSFASHAWHEYFTEHLAGAGGQVVSVEAGARGWSVRLTLEGVDVTPGGGAAGARISGAPTDVLFWLWRRAGDEAVRHDGDPALVARLRALLGPATQ
jgi:uncharacterized protein (TIGR03083 family)